MGAFSDVEMKRPPATVVVPATAFANTWVDRPEEDVCIGLRFVADADLEDARVEAYRRATGFFPNHERDQATTDLFVASFQDALVRWVIARGTCDPNDVHKPWEPWSAAPEDIVVEQALTDVGAQLIFDAWERMRIASDIGLACASDEDIALLPDLLARLPGLLAVSRPRALRIRRLLRFVLEELETVETPAAAARASHHVAAGPHDAL